MAKQLELKVKSGCYILEYNLEAIDKADAMGATLSELREKIVSTTRKLFYLALIKNHKGMTPNKAFSILDEAVAEGLAVAEIGSALIELMGSVMNPNAEEGEIVTATLTEM